MKKRSSHHISRKPKIPVKKRALPHQEKNEEMPEDIRENVLLESEDVQEDTHTNWSQAQDRSEDFINESDPFTQDPEKTPKIPRDDRF